MLVVRISSGFAADAAEDLPQHRSEHTDGGKNTD
jgi:hypothetical protein